MFFFDKEEVRKIKKIHLTIHEQGKLKGIISINTSSLKNDFCNNIGCRNTRRAERKCKSICELCYAEKNEKLRKALEACLERNNDIFSERLLTKDEIPILNNAFVRFHSFGEFINDIHVQNFLNIAKANPHVKFCLMTKRYDLVMKYPKVKNIIYIASSPLINIPLKDNSILEYFDKIFTVYEQVYACENDIKINCQGRDCMKCQNCYKKTGAKNISEILRK